MKAVESGKAVLVKVPGFVPMVVRPGSRVYCRPLLVIEDPSRHSTTVFSGDSVVTHSNTATTVVDDGVAKQFSAKSKVSLTAKHCDVVSPGRPVPARYREKKPDLIAPAASLSTQNSR
jgi:hypothetical protein